MDGYVDKGNSREPIRDWRGRTSHLIHLGPNRWDERGGEKEKEEERKCFREKDSTFFLNFLVIGPMAFGGAGRKELLHNERYT